MAFPFSFYITGLAGTSARHPVYAVVILCVDGSVARAHLRPPWVIGQVMVGTVVPYRTLSWPADRVCRRTVVFGVAGAATAAGHQLPLPATCKP